MWCENSTLSDVKLRLFYFSFWKSEKVFIDCSRNTDADEEPGVARCNVQIWSSLLRFSSCDVSMNVGFEIAFLTHLGPQTSFFCFWTVYRGSSWISPWTCAHRQLSCTSFFRTFLIFDVVCCFFWVFWCLKKVDFYALRSLWLLTFFWT